jgi:hypothetical protein
MTPTLTFVTFPPAPYDAVMPDSRLSDDLETALPSVGARIIAFVAIVIAGIAGGIIGYAFVDLQTTGDAALATGIGALVGAVVTAGGTAVVVVLTLRAMGEWRTIKERDPDAEDRRFPKGGAGAQRSTRRATPRVR